jgi:hypothetical protein
LIHIWGIILLFLVLLFLIMLVFIWYMNLMMGLIIGRKHLILEHITATGELPEEWQRKYNQRLIQLLNKGQTERMQRIQQMARRSYLRRLEGLKRYVRATKLMDSEESRAHALQLLERIRQQWEDRAEDGFNGFIH